MSESAKERWPDVPDVCAGKKAPHMNDAKLIDELGSARAAGLDAGNHVDSSGTKVEIETQV